MKRGYWEVYRCGCVSETEQRKKDLLGYCPTHGDDRRNVFTEVGKLLTAPREGAATEGGTTQ